MDNDDEKKSPGEHAGDILSELISVAAIPEPRLIDKGMVALSIVLRMRESPDGGEEIQQFVAQGLIGAPQRAQELWTEILADPHGLIIDSAINPRARAYAHRLKMLAADGAKAPGEITPVFLDNAFAETRAEDIVLQLLTIVQTVPAADRAGAAQNITGHGNGIEERIDALFKLIKNSFLKGAQNLTGAATAETSDATLDWLPEQTTPTHVLNARDLWHNYVDTRAFGSDDVVPPFMSPLPEPLQPEANKPPARKFRKRIDLRNEPPPP